MVQQNLVSYILKQLRQGRKLEDINNFLIQSGYDKEEVESSVQYVLNLQTNPQLAEQQRIQQLAQYIQKQLTAGYGQQAIANFLISRGYPYYEVNSALQQATAPKKEMKTEHKLVALSLITVLVVTSALIFFYTKAYIQVSQPLPEQLLDVETEQLTTIVQPGGDLTFQVNLMSFGTGQRFDVILKYQIIERETQSVVLEKTETVALSTTVEKIGRFDIPDDIKTGKYVLRVDATYQDFTATSGFIFEIIPTEEAEDIQEEVEEMLPEKENITEEIPPLPEEIPEAPEEEPIPTPITPTEEIWYQGKTRQQAFEQVKAVSVREPEQAIEMCNEFRLSANRQACIRTIAEFKENPLICESIEDTRHRDNCYVQIAISTGNEQACDQVSDPRVQQSCNMALFQRDVEEVRPSTDPQSLYQKMAPFGLQATPQE